MQKVYVVFGAGGVGKTTSAAALAVALAHGGMRILAITTDPARRLADVLGATNNDMITELPGVPGLAYFMPHAASNTRDVVAGLLSGSPQVADSLRRNPIFELLCSGLAGVHELMILASLGDRAAGYDAIVIDTAPSEHAVDLMSLPERISTLIDSRALQWLSKLAPTQADSQRGPGWSEPATAGVRGLSARLIDWSQRRLVSQFEKVLGGNAVSHCLELLRAVMLVRPQLAQAVTAAKAILTGADTEYVVVLAPRVGAERQAQYFADRLGAIAKPPSTYIVNQLQQRPGWLEPLASIVANDSPLGQALDLAAANVSASQKAVALTVSSISQIGSKMRIVQIPAFAGSEPRDVVSAIANLLQPLVALPLRHAVNPS